uniref:Cytochrome c oxidase subunit 2 n=1 Tax=Iberobaenia minuta TaxID=1857294 RepID=A0A3G1DH51_9COLE|nr:cytochrome c oxidase subunit 2 [Iberobaenia minuta]
METWLNQNNSASPTMEQMMMFHNNTMLIMVMIMTTVSYMLMSKTMNKLTNKNTTKNQTMELIWTIIPTTTLMFIALPSMKLLYLTDEMKSPMISIKIIGHQWYWSYELSDFKNNQINSFLKTESESKFNFRLLDSDNSMPLPFKSIIRTMTTSVDVIHAWTMQSMSIKIDASPGRLNQTKMFSNQPGTFFGQCSEICGMNHSFMPSMIEMISQKNFIKWISIQ